jgi:hypothetical protein
MPALSEYSNVYNTAILILERKGFRVWVDSKTSLYCCERDGWDFMADTPCGLLGVVAIFEFKTPKECGEYWWREDGPDRYGSLPTQAPEYVSVVDRSRRPG